MGVAYLQSWCALRRSACLSQCTMGVGCTWLWLCDHLSALTMRSGWFFLVLVTFWQIIHYSLQTKTNKKCVLWQTNRTMLL